MILVGAALIVWALFGDAAWFARHHWPLGSAGALLPALRVLAVALGLFVALRPRRARSSRADAAP
jgi:hypothetical protein